MSEKSIRYIANGIKAALFVLPFFALFVADSLFFPFITGKNFLFRIVVEISFFFWVFIAVFDKQYRPKKSFILWSLLALLIVLTLATVFGENPYRSFWSNYERMDGLVNHIHLFSYFLVLTSVMRFKKDWKILFGSMIGVGAVMTGYGFLQFFGKLAIHQSDVRLDATLGNSGYLAIFLIFNLFLVSLFFFWFKNKWIRISLIGLFVLEATVVFYTATRGAILGLVGSLFLFALLVVIFGNKKNKQIRKYFLGFLIFLLLCFVVFLIAKDSQFIKSHEVLNRLASISFEETTVESRFTIWGMSWQGLQEHTILGWGPENYNLVFNKYYEPKLYKQEPWFDRSHNIAFDWLISAGVLGLLAYLSIFVSALYIAWKLFRKNKFSLFEFSAVIALFAAYFFHNIFVFDNLTSYFMFFSVLGFLHFSWCLFREEEEQRNKKSTFIKDINMFGYFSIVTAFILVLFSLYFMNAKPIMASKNLLNSLYQMRAAQSVDVVLDEFNIVFNYNSFGTGEAREQLASYANNIIRNGSNFSQQDKINVLMRATSEMEKQVESSPNDIRYIIMLAALYRNSGRVDDAILLIDRAMEISPKKQQLYFMKADFYLQQGKTNEAIDVSKKVYELDKTYGEAAKNLAIVYLIDGNEEKTEEILMERFGTTLVLDTRFVNAYIKLGRFDKVRDIWKGLVLRNPNNIQYRIKLVASYLQLNEKEKAIEVLEEVLVLNIDAETKEQIKSYIREIK